MIFKDTWVFLLIPVVILYAYFVKKKNILSGIRFSSGELVKDSKITLKLLFAKNLFYLRVVAIILFILALARPRVPLEETKIQMEGIDIVLAIDCSGSMLAEDFKIDRKRRSRFEVVKEVVEDFIRERKSDKIGMIAFAARAYTVCPLTLDYDWLIKNLERVKIGAIEDGTAIGSAIGSSLNRLKDTVAKSKVVILLTDGINNAGKVAPQTAAEAAKALGIKIYTIGVGTKGLASYPVKGLWGEKVYQKVKIEIDEDVLKQIAEITEGYYFRATSTETLREIYDQIDALEKTTVEESGFQEYKELFAKFLILALILLMLEIVLSNTILRKLP